MKFEAERQQVVGPRNFKATMTAWYCRHCFCCCDEEDGSKRSLLLSTVYTLPMAVGKTTTFCRVVLNGSDFLVRQDERDVVVGWVVVLYRLVVSSLVVVWYQLVV